MLRKIITFSLIYCLLTQLSVFNFQAYAKSPELSKKSHKTKTFEGTLIDEINSYLNEINLVTGQSINVTKSEIQKRLKLHFKKFEQARGYYISLYWFMAIVSYGVITSKKREYSYSYYDKSPWNKKRCTEALNDYFFKSSILPEYTRNIKSNYNYSIPKNKKEIISKQIKKHVCSQKEEVIKSLVSLASEQSATYGLIVADYDNKLKFKDTCYNTEMRKIVKALSPPIKFPLLALVELNNLHYNNHFLYEVGGGYGNPISADGSFLIKEAALKGLGTRQDLKKAKDLAWRDHAIKGFYKIEKKKKHEYDRKKYEYVNKEYYYVVDKKYDHEVCKISNPEIFKTAFNFHLKRERRKYVFKKFKEYGVRTARRKLKKIRKLAPQEYAIGKKLYYSYVLEKVAQINTKAIRTQLKDPNAKLNFDLYLKLYDLPNIKLHDFPNNLGTEFRYAIGTSKATSYYANMMGIMLGYNLGKYGFPRPKYSSIKMWPLADKRIDQYLNNLSRSKYLDYGIALAEGKNNKALKILLGTKSLPKVFPEVDQLLKSKIKEVKFTAMRYVRRLPFRYHFNNKFKKEFLNSLTKGFWNAVRWRCVVRYQYKEFMKKKVKPQTDEWSFSDMVKGIYYEFTETISLIGHTGLDVGDFLKTTFIDREPGKAWDNYGNRGANYLYNNWLTGRPGSLIGAVYDSDYPFLHGLWRVAEVVLIVKMGAGIALKATSGVSKLGLAAFTGRTAFSATTKTAIVKANTVVVKKSILRSAYAVLKHPISVAFLSSLTVEGLKTHWLSNHEFSTEAVMWQTLAFLITLKAFKGVQHLATAAGQGATFNVLLLGDIATTIGFSYEKYLKADSTRKLDQAKTQLVDSIIPIAIAGMLLRGNGGKSKMSITEKARALKKIRNKALKEINAKYRLKQKFKDVKNKIAAKKGSSIQKSADALKKMRNRYPKTRGKIDEVIPERFYKGVFSQEEIFTILNTQADLGIKLTPTQKYFLIKAHNIGKNQIGADGKTKACIGNYTGIHIRHKHVELRKAFNFEQACTILFKGRAGKGKGKNKKTSNKKTSDKKAVNENIVQVEGIAGEVDISKINSSPNGYIKGQINPNASNIIFIENNIYLGELDLLKPFNVSKLADHPIRVVVHETNVVGRHSPNKYIYVMEGNHRIFAAGEQGLKDIPVLIYTPKSWRAAVGQKFRISGTDNPMTVPGFRPKRANGPKFNFKSEKSSNGVKTENKTSKSNNKPVRLSPEDIQQRITTLNNSKKKIFEEVVKLSKELIENHKDKKRIKEIKKRLSDLQLDLEKAYTKERNYRKKIDPEFKAKDDAEKISYDKTSGKNEQHRSIEEREAARKKMRAIEEASDDIGSHKYTQSINLVSSFRTWFKNRKKHWKDIMEDTGENHSNAKKR